MLIEFRLRATGALRLLGVSAAVAALTIPHLARASTIDRPESISTPSTSDIARCDGALKALKVGLLIGGSVSSPEQWSLVEEKIWHRLCERRKFREKDWPEVLASAAAPREVHAEFIRAIVASNNFDVPGYDFINIEGATILGDLDLSHEILRSGLALRNCVITGTTNLDFFRSGHDIDLSGTSFRQGISGTSMRVDGSIYMGDQTDRFLGPEAKAAIKSINFEKAAVSGELVVKNVATQDRLSLYGATIGKTLTIKNSSLKSIELDLLTANQLELIRDEVNNERDNLSAVDVTIAGTVFLDRSTFLGDVYMMGINIGSDLSLRGAELSSLDLTGARVGGEFLMGPAVSRESRGGELTKWVNKSYLGIDHANMRIIRAEFAEWPNKLDLDGFEYHGFSPSSVGQQITTRNLDVEEMKAWLEKARFSPSSYLWLQRVLNDAGLDQQARAIGIAQKDRERAQALADRRYGDWMWLWILWLFIGYGYIIWLALIWAAALTIIGALVFRTTSESKEYFMPYGISYSFDMLLPIIKLREKHYEIDIGESFQRYYFYFHRVMGFVIGSFLAAGLSGLTR